MFKWLKKYQVPAGSRPVARHSQLLALEPRQVFDAAVGAAIAEVLAAPSEPADNVGTQNENSQPGSENQNALAERLAEGGGDNSLIQALSGGIGPQAANNDPIFNITGSPAADKNTPFSLEKITVNDYDNDQLTLTLTIQNGGRFYKGDTDKGTSITLTGSKDDINAALKDYSFKPSANQDGTAVVIYSLKDQPGAEVEGFFDITVSKVNTDPVLTIKDNGDDRFAAVLQEDAISAIKGISVADADNDDLTLTISAEKGLFNIGRNAGVTVEGQDSGTLVLKGKAGSINSILATLKYTSPDTSIGDVEFSITLADGQKTVTETRTVLINDQPTIAIDPAFNGTVKEYSYHADDVTDENKLYFGAITVDDLNDTDELTLTVTLDGTEIGQLYLAGAVAGTGKTFTFTGTKAEVNAKLAALYFQANKNRSGDLTFTLTVQDKFGTPVELAQEHATISVTPFNDHPDVNISINPDDWLNVFEGNRDGANPEAPGSKDNNKLTLEHFGLSGEFDVVKGKGISDPDTPADQVMITIKSLPQYGHLMKGGQIMGEGATFTLAQLRDGLITYDHFGTDVPTNGLLDGFTFSVDDGSGFYEAQGQAPFEVNIKLNPYNDDFSIVSEGETVKVGDTDHLVLWAWERQTDAPLSFSRDIDAMPGGGFSLKAGDDLPQNIKVTLDSAPQHGALYFLKGDGTKVYLAKDGALSTLPDGFQLTGADLGNLYYEATDMEPGDVGDLTFSLTFTDRQNLVRDNDDFTVDPSADGEKSHTVNFLIKIAPNNDDPVYDQNSTGLTNPSNTDMDGRWFIDHDDSTRVKIDSGMLNVTDADSVDDKITFTIKDLKNLNDYGRLILVRNGTTMYLSAGHSFTMADINALGTDGLYFEYWGGTSNNVGTGTIDHSPEDGGATHTWYDLNFSFEYIVRDGAVTSWLPDDGSGNYDDPDYHTSHQGGIYENYGPNGEYLPNGPSAGNPLKTMTFEAKLRVCERQPGNPPVDGDGPVPPKVDIDSSWVPLIYEGDNNGGKSYEFTLTGKYYDTQAGYDDRDDNHVMLHIFDPDTPPEKLVLSLFKNLKGGHLEVNRGSGFERIFVGDNFTMRMVLDGQVKYVHDGDEVFQDSLVFVVSDGMAYVDKTSDDSAPISIHVDIIPWNDGPSLGVSDQSRLVVDEGGSIALKGGSYAGDYDGDYPDGLIFRYYDPDNVDLSGDPKYKDKPGLALNAQKHQNDAGNRVGPDDVFKSDSLTFTIDRIPEKRNAFL